MIMPPREKIHEALSAVADNRVIINDQNKCADVSSSDNCKKYLVEWEDNTYSSNDNATFWKGYPGYPIIAILLMQGKIDYDKSILPHFKNINWKAINTKFRNDYAASVNSVFQGLENQGVDTKFIDEEINKIYNALKTMDIVVKKSKMYPPK